MPYCKFDTRRKIYFNLSRLGDNETRDLGNKVN